MAHTTLQNPLPVKTRLERITKGELEKVRRALSWIILLALLGKLALFFNFVDISDIVSKSLIERIVTKVVVTGGWPWWQFALVADALLTFLLLWFSDAALSRLDGPGAWGEDFVLKTTSTVSFVRAALSIVTMSHFFRVALLATVPITRLV